MGSTWVKSDEAFPSRLDKSICSQRSPLAVHKPISAVKTQGCWAALSSPVPELRQGWLMSICITHFRGLPMWAFPVSLESFSSMLTTLSFSDHVLLLWPHPSWVLQGMVMVMQQDAMRTGGSPGRQSRSWQPLLLHHLSQKQPGAPGHPLSHIRDLPGDRDGSGSSRRQRRWNLSCS